MATMQELEDRIEHLEYKIELLLSLADTKRDLVTAAILSTDLTRAQTQAIFNLIEKTKQQIIAGNSPSREEFELALDAIKPPQPGDGDPDLRASWFHAGAVAKLYCNARRYTIVREYLEAQHVTF